MCNNFSVVLVRPQCFHSFRLQQINNLFSADRKRTTEVFLARSEERRLDWSSREREQAAERWVANDYDNDDGKICLISGIYSGLCALCAFCELIFSIPPYSSLSFRSIYLLIVVFWGVPLPFQETTLATVCWERLFLNYGTSFLFFVEHFHEKILFNSTAFFWKIDF